MPDGKPKGNVVSPRQRTMKGRGSKGGRGSRPPEVATGRQKGRKGGRKAGPFADCLHRRWEFNFHNHRSYLAHDPIEECGTITIVTGIPHPG